MTSLSGAVKPTANVETLLLCRDPQALNVLHPLLQSAGTDTQLCSIPDLAVEMLARWRFDAVVVDCDGIEGANDVLRSLRAAPSNRTAIAFALVTGNTTIREAFEMGATFVLDKPLSKERARASLQAAYGLMLYNRRRYHRHPVLLPAVFVPAGGTETEVTILNISEGGAGVDGAWRLQPGQEGRLLFELPGQERGMVAPAQVVWANKGRAGLQFRKLCGATAWQLHRWLAEKFSCPQAESDLISRETQ